MGLKPRELAHDFSGRGKVANASSRLRAYKGKIKEWGWIKYKTGTGCESRPDIHGISGLEINSTSSNVVAASNTVPEGLMYVCALMNTSRPRPSGMEYVSF